MSKNFDDADKGKDAAGQSGNDDRSREPEDKTDQSESGDGDGDVTEKAMDKAKEKAGEAIDSAGEKLKNVFKRG